jgi:hypothetical protein
MVLVNVIDQFLEFDFEHSGYQIGSILKLLSEWQRSLNFKPLGIASDYNKRIRAAGPSANCHGILIILNHVTWTYYERRWQNNPLANGNNAIVTCNVATLALGSRPRLGVARLRESRGKKPGSQKEGSPGAKAKAKALEGCEPRGSPGVITYSQESKEVRGSVRE